MASRNMNKQSKIRQARAAFQSMIPKAPFSLFAASISLFQLLLPWLTLCSERLCMPVHYKSLQLTKESLDDFTFHLTGGSTNPHSVRLPADLATEASNAKLWIKYIVGSAAVLGSVDRCALGVIHGIWNSSGIHCFPDMLKELVKQNGLDTVVHFIARNAGRLFWNTIFGRDVIKLMKDNWGAMRPLSEKILAILRESDDRSKDYDVILGCVPVELQYERISSGKTCLDEIDKICPLDEPYYPLLKEIFFQARCAPNPSLQIREHIAEKVPWFKQFMPEEIPSSAKDTCVTSIVEPGHDVWVRIRSFMDAETLIFVWPLVCQTWNKSYSKILAEETRIQEWFLQDLSRIDLDEIRTIAPWNHFLNENNSAAYMGQCIVNGSLGRIKLDGRLSQQVRDYMYDAMKNEGFIPRSRKESTTYGSLAKLLEEGYKACPREMPVLFKPPFLTVEEHERVIRHLVRQNKLVVRLDCQWIVDNASRIYSVLGDDQDLVEQIVHLSAYDFRGYLFLQIMIEQACGMAEETAKLALDEPETSTKFIKTVFFKPKQYGSIVTSGMLLEIVSIYHKKIAPEIPRRGSCPAQELNYLMISIILFFKDRPTDIEKIVAYISGQLPTYHGAILESIRDWLGAKTMEILVNSGKYLPEDVEFIREVLVRCRLLNRVTA